MEPVRIIVQLNGKKIEDFWTTEEITTDATERIALNIPAVKKALKNKEITKIVVVPKKVVNIQTKG